MDVSIHLFRLKSNGYCDLLLYTIDFQTPSHDKLSKQLIILFCYSVLISKKLRLYLLRNMIEKYIMLIRLIEKFFTDCMILNYISSKLSALKYPHHIFYRVYKIMIGYAVVFRCTFICSRSSKLHQIAWLQIRVLFL